MLKFPHSTQIYLFFFILTFLSCKERAGNDIDTSKIDINIKIERFDQDFSQLDSIQALQQNAIWQKKYGQFYTDYIQLMLHAGNPGDSLSVQRNLRTISRQPDFKALSTSVAKVFPDLKKQEEGLTEVFKRMKYFFPELHTPRFISFYSGFEVQTPIGEDYIGIGLDMFLGSDSEFYPALVSTIPLYISKRFTPENIVPRVTESFIREELYPQQEGDVNTLQHMIYQGKILYAMDQVMPDVADSLKIGYSAQQMKWAEAYEKEIWAWFIQEELLYNTDYLRIQKYFAEAPFTPELGENNESAPKLGSYIGWQIVRKYMNKHPESDLKKLFAIKDAQLMLDESKYKGSK
ncbi:MULTISPECIES: gliding motility lipoprotein GldB [unclassified Sphingobacterium]|uniref:gliding motility lipoprotein GldB n=1 Tax=unclassified Sphingobacterium TaxID=2609468 RepID=UPI0025F14CF4|nr:MULTISPECIES: gliding motility lipoprotein GldB [unclassified Sphingobacterium]